MGIIDSAVDINELSQGKLVVIYGKSGSGKTKFASTFVSPFIVPLTVPQLNVYV